MVLEMQQKSLIENSISNSSTPSSSNLLPSIQKSNIVNFTHLSLSNLMTKIISSRDNRFQLPYMVTNYINISVKEVRWQRSISPLMIKPTIMLMKNLQIGNVKTNYWYHGYSVQWVRLSLSMLLVARVLVK